MKDDEENLFREAVKNVKPLKIKSKTIEIIGNKPKPIAKKFLEDEQKVLVDSLSDDYIYEDGDLENGLLFLRSGHSPDIIKKLKKGYWVVQGSIDLAWNDFPRSKIIYCKTIFKSVKKDILDV